MPKKVIYTREEIIEKAYEMFKSEGLNQITARTLAKKLKTSPAPIYGHFDSRSGRSAHRPVLLQKRAHPDWRHCLLRLSKKFYHTVACRLRRIFCLPCQKWNTAFALLSQCQRLLRLGIFQRQFCTILALYLQGQTRSFYPDLKN